ncbi:MAG: anti-sigma factor antagonist [Desulfobacteraceae bacterium]|nr:MAG: anti-sigma factor antagonist [Desulfobacteraceae bacterium]
MDLRVSVKQKALNAWVVSLDGSLNSDTAATFGERIRPILATPSFTLVLDMEGLSYISSAGVREVLKAQKAQKGGQGRLVFMHLQPQIRKVFEIVDALPSMRIFAGVEEMDAYLDRMQKQVTHPGESDD